MKFPANHKNIGFIAGSYSDFFNVVHMITPKTKENAFEENIDYVGFTEKTVKPKGGRCIKRSFRMPKKERL